MSKELQVQSQIVKSVERDGGWAKKLTNRFKVGIPDLLIVYPGYIPVVIEVKDFGLVPGRFDRQIDTTPLQEANLKKISQVCPGAAGILVAIQTPTGHYLVACSATQERLSHDHLADPRAWQKRMVGGRYCLPPLLDYIGVPKR